MNRLVWVMLMGCSVFSPTVLANDLTEKPVPLPGPHVGVGRMMPNIQGTTLDGKAFDLQKALSGKKGFVVALSSQGCPLCQKYVPSFAALEKELAKQNIGLVLVNPVETDDQDKISAALKAAGLTAPYIHDKDRTIAKSIGATSTTDTFLIDAKRTIIYRGAVDDQYGIGYSKANPTETYLKNAIQSMLAERLPEVAATTSPGCELDLSKVEVAKATVTYHNRISRLINTHCAECHRDGGVGPFELTSLEDIASHAGVIKRVVTKQTMPPWFAKEDLKAGHSMFQNNTSMPETDRNDLLAWFEAEMPEGDKADAPLERKYPEEWMIGKPDQIFQIDQKVKVKATGVMPYENILIETNLEEDKWVEAVEIHPTNRAVVHHVLVFVIPPKTGFELFKPRPNGSESLGFFAAYVPGNSYQILPKGFGSKLPKGCRLMFQIHYTPNGTACEDQTQLAVKYAKEEPKEELRVYGLANPRDLKIPAGDDNYEQYAQITLPFSVVLTAMSPHMHVRGKACKYEAFFPDGTHKVLLDMPKYDFNWQLQYKLAEPLTLPAGTKLKYTAWYDNSDKNPANPDSTVMVKWGPQTFDEMLLGYMVFYRPGLKGNPFQRKR